MPGHFRPEAYDRYARAIMAMRRVDVIVVTGDVAFHHLGIETETQKSDTASRR